jgi:hypothetical protein
MVGIGTFFLEQNERFSLGQSIGRLGIVAGRPNFELQFNILQNQLINQLADKIDTINGETVVNNVDVFLELEKKRLERLQPVVNQYAADALFNVKSVNGLIGDLGDLQTLAGGTDAVAFDNLLGQLNSDVTNLKRLNGYTIGFNVSDGLDNERRDGFAINDFASYATVAEREAAVATALADIQSSQAILVINADNATDFKNSVSEKLISVSLQIEAVQLADTSEKLAEIEKLRVKHGRFLQTLSLAFEAAQARADTLSEALLKPPQVTKGTVLDLLT